MFADYTGNKITNVCVTDDSLTYAAQKSKQPYIPGLNYAGQNKKAPTLEMKSPERESLSVKINPTPGSNPTNFPNMGLPPPSSQ